MVFKYEDPKSMVAKVVGTLGIYILFWLYNTKNALNKAGGLVPSFVLFFIPLARWYFFYAFARDFAKIVLKDSKRSMAVLLMFVPFLTFDFISVMGDLVLPHAFNIHLKSYFDWRIARLIPFSVTATVASLMVQLAFGILTLFAIVIPMLICQMHINKLVRHKNA